MADSYFIFSKNGYETVVLPDSVVTEWGLPIVDEDDAPISYTIEQAFNRASLDTAPPVPIVINGDGTYSNSTKVSNTHWLCPLNNVSVDMDKTFEPLAAAEGKQYNEVKFTHKQIVNMQSN